MDAMDDFELLSQYAKSHSEAAFTTLVERHAGLVYSAALRSMGKPHDAEEVSQAVFVILARKAHTLHCGISLCGWLHRATRFAAADALKTQRRRQQREKKAAQMQTVITNEPTWEQLAPFLDEAVARLPEKERNAVLLRYFEDKSLAEIGAVLGVEPDAARMRVTRALEKLRSFLVRRGVALSAAALGSLLAANSTQAVPAGLVGAAAKIALLQEGATAASVWALAKGALKMMTWMKAKAGMGLGMGLVALTASVVLLQGSREHLSLRGRTIGNGPGYRAEGVLDCSFFASDGYLWRTQLLRFNVKVEGPRWQITNFEKDDQYWVRGSDGDAIYHVFRDQRSGFADDPGLVEPGPMPWGGYPCAVVWLALASGRYLDRTNSMFGPWADPYS